MFDSIILSIEFIPMADELVMARVVYNNVSLGKEPNRSFNTVSCRKVNITNRAKAISLWMWAT